MGRRVGDRHHKRAAPDLAGVARHGLHLRDDGARAALVFFTKEVKRWVLDAMLGFAGGVMIAASYFSLLAPAIELAEGRG
nr:hypothetical protein [Rubrobacter marinus]